MITRRFPYGATDYTFSLSRRQQRFQSRSGSRTSTASRSGNSKTHGVPSIPQSCTRDFPSASISHTRHSRWDTARDGYSPLSPSSIGARRPAMRENREECLSVARIHRLLPDGASHTDQGSHCIFEPLDRQSISNLTQSGRGGEIARLTGIDGMISQLACVEYDRLFILRHP